MAVESLSALADECYIGDLSTEEQIAKQAIADYSWVKENVIYRCSYWGVPEETLVRKSGACGIKAELLGELLELHGIQVRYVEGRPIPPILPAARITPLNVHFWVEAKIGNKWLALDPAPDSGITLLLGETLPGTHLVKPRYIARWNKIPDWYKRVYNHPLVWPLRLASNMKLTYHRTRRNHHDVLSL